jgi:CRP-like cAMP-binding protein
MTGEKMQEHDLRAVFLDEIGQSAFDALFASARLMTFPAGATIFSAGDPGDFVFLIEDGRIEISTLSLAGRKSVLAHMGPGGLLGEIAALDGGSRSADAVAATTVTGRSLARSHLIDYISRTPTLAQAVIIELCQKARNASEMFVTQTTPEAEIRLARALLRLFDGWGKADDSGATILTERFSQQDLGAFCGLARENVNRQIKKWTDQGLLASRGRQMVLLDRAGLDDIAESGQP